jgi:hypothetical protein
MKVITGKGLPADEIKDWQESLREMSSESLMDEWKIARKLTSTPPTAGTIVIAIDGTKEQFSTEEYASGAFFQISQLIKAEMTRRGIAVPGVKR